MMHMKRPENEIDMVSVVNLVKAKGITQKQISKAIGASQSQVSRVLSGASSQRSKLIEKICKYVKYAGPVVSLESVRSNDELMAALAATWDGTPDHSAALATVIRSLRVLAPDASSATRR